ncbi:hypothetical protein [Halapricum desulfuricans]|uniref:Uncharacterized protein n=1 Tax=Halapricum desulfuricans TaxID=2841257 RepID=A0A897N423_9EURY|nr:hypothetical protein [Halapricum desulfuricans]QSG07241.1 hypothetical protein HSR121_2924 [Halapricum desulfuricans]
MPVDSATCPHCGTRLTGDDLEKLTIKSDSIAPMGAGKKNDTLYVCPSCDVILG